MKKLLQLIIILILINSGSVFAVDSMVYGPMPRSIDTPADEECYTYESTGNSGEWQACGAGALAVTETNANTVDDTLVCTDGASGRVIQQANTACAGAITGNAGTATALAADPADCGAGTVATAIAASGALTCSITPLVSASIDTVAELDAIVADALLPSIATANTIDNHLMCSDGATGRVIEQCNAASTMSQDLTFSDCGTTCNSSKLTFVADNTGVTQSGYLQVINGTNPYLAIYAPNNSGTATPSAYFRDNNVSVGDGTVDSFTSLFFDGLSTDGEINYDGSNTWFLYNRHIRLAASQKLYFNSADIYINNTGWTSSGNLAIKPVLSLTLGAGAVGVDYQRIIDGESANLTETWFEDEKSLRIDGKRNDLVQSVTCTDGAGVSALTITPTSSYIEITNADVDGCNITLSETNALVGDITTMCIISNAGTTVNFADTAGVTELAGAFAADIDDCINLRYGAGTTWREVSRSVN